MSGQVDPRSQRGVWERERLFAAMADEVAECGYEQTSSAMVAARAGLTEADFNAHFADKEACFLETFDSLIAQIYAQALSAYRARRAADCDWRDCVRAALLTLVHGVYMRTAAARVCLLEARGAGPRAREHCDGALVLLAEAVAEVLADAPDSSRPSPIVVTAIAGAIWHTLATQLREDFPADPSELAAELLNWLVPRDGSPVVGSLVVSTYKGDPQASTIGEAVEFG